MSALSGGFVTVLSAELPNLKTGSLSICAPVSLPRRIATQFRPKDLGPWEARAKSLQLLHLGPISLLENPEDLSTVERPKYQKYDFVQRPLVILLLLLLLSSPSSLRLFDPRLFPPFIMIMTRVYRLGDVACSLLWR